MPHVMVPGMKFYGGYGITEMRAMAREYGIVGRSKMSGDQLLTALHARWDAKRQTEERRVLAEVRGPWVGAELVMACGCVIRATTAPQTSERHGGALFVRAWYVSLCANEMFSIAYLNRPEHAGSYRFMLHQLHANTKTKAA